MEQSPLDDSGPRHPDVAHEVLALDLRARGRAVDARVLARSWALLRRADLTDADHETVSRAWQALLDSFEGTHGPIQASYFAASTEQAVLLTSSQAEGQAASVHAAIDPAAPAAARATSFVLSDIASRARETLPRPEVDTFELRVYGIFVALCDTLNAPLARDASRQQRLDVIDSEATRLRALLDSAAERAADARFAATLGAGSLFVAITLAVALIATSTALTKYPVVVCGAAGVAGAFVSVLSRMTAKRSSGALVLSRRLLTVSALARLVIGALFALTAYVLVKGGVLGLKPTATDTTAFYAALGFVAGFAERFAADIRLETATSRERMEAPSPQVAQPPSLSEVTSLVEETLQGSPLVPWSGWVSTSLREESSERLPEDSTAPWRLRPGRRYAVEVVFSPVPTGLPLEREVAVQGTSPASEVQFSIRIDSDEDDVVSDSTSVLVAQGRPASVPVTIEVIGATPGPQRLWLHIKQRGTTVGVFPIEARIADA